MRNSNTYSHPSSGRDLPIRSSSEGRATWIMNINTNHNIKTTTNNNNNACIYIYIYIHIN